MVYLSRVDCNLGCLAKATDNKTAAGTGADNEADSAAPMMSAIESSAETLLGMCI